MLFSSQTPSPVTHQHSSNLVHSTHAYLPVKMEQIECSETSAYKLQTPGNCPKESIQHSTNFPKKIYKSRLKMTGNITEKWKNLCAVDPKLLDAAVQNLVSSACLSRGICIPGLYPYNHLTLMVFITSSLIVPRFKYRNASDLVVLSANIGTSACVTCCGLA
jgi:hypothetical protein